MNETRDDRLEILLEELIAYTRFMARSDLEDALRTTLRDERHRVAFELTDGTRSQVQIGLEAGLAQSAVSDLWKKWRRLGLLRDRDGRPKHLVRPSDLGIGTPVAAKKQPRGAPAEEGGSDA